MGRWSSTRSLDTRSPSITSDANRRGRLPRAVTDRRKGLLYIVLAALLWSTGGIGIKYVIDPALKVTFYRSVFAAITLFLIFRKHVRVRWSPAFLAAIVSYGVCLTSFVIATKWTTAANE